MKLGITFLSVCCVIFMYKYTHVVPHAPRPCASTEARDTLCHARYRVKANKLSGYFAMNSDVSVALRELSLVLYTFCLGNNTLLFLLSIESSSGSSERKAAAASK